jgi:thioredoxin-related protein
MKTSVIATLLLLVGGNVFAGEPAWLTDVPQAAQLAKQQDKLILLDFTGSDWCGWCKKLDAETFSQQAFLDYAAKNLVLVQLDFPRHAPQSDDLKAANEALGKQFDVKGYPTVILLKPDGTQLWKQVGYLKGGPAAMIDKIAKADPTRPAPDDIASTAPSPSPAPAPAAKQPAPVQWASLQWPAPPARKEGDEPKLQGIFFSSHPSIILNGKSCEEGDTVDGARVVKIERDKVTVQWNGAAKELRLAD